MTEEGFGIARKSVYWLIVIFLVIAIIFFFALILNNYRNTLKFVYYEVPDEIYFYRAINCFSEINEDINTKNTYIIDLNRFNEENLQKCFDADINNYGFQLTIGDKTIKTQNYIEGLGLHTIKRKVVVKTLEGYRLEELIFNIQPSRSLARIIYKQLSK